MGARTFRGKTRASIATLANTYQVGPSASVAYVSGPVAAGNAPPMVIMTGQPNAGAGSPVAGIVTVTITGGGGLGTATYRLSYNGTSVVTGTTAAVVDLSAGAGIILYFDSDSYDTTQSWTWRTGVTNQALFSGGTPLLAVGQMPVDVSGNLTMTDSVLARMHGTLTLTLPVAPWDGMRVSILDADGTANTNPITVSASGGTGKVQDPYNLATVANTSMTIRLPYQQIDLMWDSEFNSKAGLWRIAGDSQAGELPLGSQIFTTGTFQLTGKCWAQCNPAGGAVTIKLPTAPTDGMRVRVSDVTGNAATHNITVDAGAGKTVDNLVLGGGASAILISTDNQSATWAYRASGTTWNLIGVN